MSANTGGKICFYDSVYSAATTDLNKDGNGSIIFSGKYVAEDLAALNENAELADSCEEKSLTSSFYGNTILHQGTLSIQDGAIVNFSNLTIKDGAAISVASGATLYLNYADTSVGALTLSNGTVTLGSDTYHPYALITTALDIEENSTVNANLAVTHNGKLTFTDSAVLTLGCSVYIGNDVIVVLDDDVVTALSNGSLASYEVMNSVDSATLGQVIIQNTKGESSSTPLTLVYDSENGKVVAKKGTSDRVSDEIPFVTPEPDTATLSLLALAGLAVRRRRLR